MGSFHHVSANGNGNIIPDFPAAGNGDMKSGMKNAARIMAIQAAGRADQRS